MKKMKTLTVCGQTFCVCDEGAVKHDEVQELTYEQRNTARNNIRALSWETDVLEPGQQAQARANIGAASTMDTYGTVKYTEQKLTGEQKQQAVENIQAVSYRPGQNLGPDSRSAARQNIGAVSKAQALTAVEEKHFYEMGEPLVPETTVNCDLANSSGIYYSSISNKGAAIIEMKPETVVVVVNGEQHKLTVQYSHNPDGTVNSAYIGNRSFLGTGYADNGEDYLFSYSATTGSVAVMYSRTSGEKTFSIHVAGNVLADEYLNPLVIKAKPQALTAAMMQQARENIGAVGAKEAIEAVEDEFFEKGFSPIYPEETVPCVATAFNGGTVYKGTLSANGADFYNANYEKVYVKIGGETVKCSVEYWMGDPGAKYAEIGNKHLRLSSAADTGEDFCIDYRLANGPSVIYTRAAGDVTFTVNTPVPVMKQEYLPPMGAADAVTYTAQELTDEQKAQARENIGAAAVGEGGGEVGDITWDDVGVTYGDTLTWDGNTDGLPNVMGTYFKVSDAVPTVADVQKGGYIEAMGERREIPANTSEEDGIIAIYGVVIVFPEAAGVDMDGVMFPEAGTYFVKAPEAYIEEFYLNGYTGFPVKEKIPVDRLPLDEIDITWDDVGVTYGDTLTWDGNADGLPNVMGTYFKVSDAVPTVADVQKGGYIEAMGERVEIPADIPEEDLVIDGIIPLLGAAFVVYPEAVGVDMDGVMFPEAGTYFVKAPEVYAEELRLNGYAGFKTAEKIPKGRLPETTTLYFTSSESFGTLKAGYIYLDKELTVKATKQDIPEKMDFILGAVYASGDARTVDSWLRPTAVNMSVMGTPADSILVTIGYGQGAKILVTAEYTG